MLLDKKIFNDTSGQATVEAAVMIPVIFLMILLLLEPGILLYDLVVMNEAAAEGCRVLCTASDSQKTELCEPYIKRRLGSIPQQQNFHMHDPQCTYEINLNGNENSQEVSVDVKNQVKPLPLIGFLSSCLGILNDSGCFEITASATQQNHPT